MTTSCILRSKTSVSPKLKDLRGNTGILRASANVFLLFPFGASFIPSCSHSFSAIQPRTPPSTSSTPPFKRLSRPENYKINSVDDLPI
ncbi:hypothetical protein P8452_27172 [Trifolium repens]|nr:hypothetical protein QL285_063060 [Trifolium repens]WJX39650.1 hypothetical protein P8452_27172 [Trifolium repens]